MAKRKKDSPTPTEPEFPPPENMSEDLADMTAIASGCMSIADKPFMGIFTVVTQIGHYDFLIDEELANEMVQVLREFLRGDSKNMLEPD